MTRTAPLLLLLAFGTAFGAEDTPLFLRCEYTDLNKDWKWELVKIDFTGRTLSMDSYTNTQGLVDKTSWKLVRVTDEYIRAVTDKDPNGVQFMEINRVTGTWQRIFQLTDEQKEALQRTPGNQLDPDGPVGTLGRCEKAEQKF